MTINDPVFINALHWIVDILKKHHVPFQVTGGVAAHIYGAVRPLNDIDLDIPEDAMEKILSDVKAYITFGPEHQIADKWDVKLLTLNYKGQVIDIGGAFDTKIFNEQTKQWVQCPANLETAELHTIHGITVPVVNPHDLITYKKLLNGDHQKTDIIAVEEYISKIDFFS